MRSNTRPRTVTNSPRTAHDRERSLPASNAIDRERSWLTDYEIRPRTVTIRLERHLVANDHHLPRTAVDRERSHLIICRERHRPRTVLFHPMPRTASTANGPDSPQMAYDPERSSFEVRRLTMNGRASSQIARSRTVVIWGHIKYQALYRLSTGYEHPAHGITKHAFLPQGIFWGAKCYPIFWSKLEYQQIGKELWISGLEIRLQWISSKFC